MWKFYRLILIVVTVLSAFSAQSSELYSKQYASPLKFSSEIEVLLQQDVIQKPKVGSVVITGSSTIRMWHPRIHQDLKELTITARGFGGSNMNDLYYFSDQLISRYQPRAVVIYEGDNDIALGLHPTQITNKLVQLSKKLWQKNLKLRIYFISIKPSITRWKMWTDMVTTNGMIRALCDKNENMVYIDAAAALLKNGLLKDRIFLQDGLHLNKRGYDLWTKAVKKVLMDKEVRFEG